MAVITSSNDIAYPLLRVQVPCSLCEKRIDRPPFIVWRSSRDLYLCEHCCKQLAQGLVADLIQVDAILKLQNIAGYHSLTFHIERTGEREQREREEIRRRDAELLRQVDEDLKK